MRMPRVHMIDDKNSAPISLFPIRTPQGLETSSDYLELSELGPVRSDELGLINAFFNLILCISMSYRGTCFLK